MDTENIFRICEFNSSKLKLMRGYCFTMFVYLNLDKNFLSSKMFAFIESFELDFILVEEKKCLYPEG